MLAGYQEDLAYIHDVGFGTFSSESAPALLEILHQKGINKGLVVDLGCGSGIWAKALTQAGYDVLGVLKFYSNLAPGNMDVKTTTTCKVGKVFNIE